MSQDEKRMPALEQTLLNARGELANSLAAREFYVRSGNDADRDIVEHVFADRAYDIRKYFGGDFNAGRLTARYRAIRKAGKCPLIVDAGAMIGATAVYYQFAFPESLVVAVEPEPTNYALLEKNCEGLNVRAVRGAVASTNKPLYLSDPGMGHFGFRTAETGLFEISAFSLDRLLRDYDASLYEPFICKINIEGGEAELFSDNVGWMDAFAAIQIELHDWMLPGTATSRNFFAAIIARNFDFVSYGVEAVCFNNDLLPWLAPKSVDLESLDVQPELGLGHVDRAVVTGLGDGRSESSRPVVLPKGSRLEIEGWAADPIARSAGRGLIARIGDMKIDLSGGYGTHRPDVSLVLGGSEGSDHCGFDAIIEASDLPSGRHELLFGVVAATGEKVFTLGERIELIVGTP